MRVFFIQSLLITFVLWFGLHSVYAAEFGTVISVIGQASAKSDAQGQWQQLKNGHKISEGDVIKTSKKASVRLLNPNGSMMRITGGQEQVYRIKKITKKKKRAFSSFVKSFFGNRDRRRIAAVRKFGSDPKQPIWIELMGKEQLSADDLELVIELAGTYQEQEKSNRSAALMWKLKEDFPEQLGFHILTKDVMEAHQQTVSWHVFKRIQGDISPAMPGDVLTENNGLQIQYQSDKESFYYLFLTTSPQDGELDTELLQPTKIGRKKELKDTQWFESRVSPNTPLTLPPDNFFALDNTKGKEYLWGWSCMGPVTQSAIIKKSIAEFEKLLRENPVFSKEQLVQITPEVCKDVFMLNIEHQ
ncbi:MAG: hypothetical protein HQM14_17740 [SAR324 cluster bacterium]|nr:hypothetical protein [SAR324 cluster bacterium]